MMLVLRIMSCKRQDLVQTFSHQFDTSGGTIGRDEGNDWVLADPDSLVSRVHARIEHRDRAFYIVDLSTNGVFVNGASEPLGHHDEHRIDHGDQLRLGDYLILAELQAKPTEPAASPLSAPTSPDPSPIASAPEGNFPPPPAQTADGGPTERGVGRELSVKVDYGVEWSDLASSTLSLDISVENSPADELERPTSIRLALETVEKLRRDSAPGRTDSLKALMETHDDLSRLRQTLGRDKLDDVVAAVVDDYLADRSVPISVTDNVQFSVSGPSSMQPGNWYTLDVWVHTEAQRGQVRERAMEAQDFEGLRIKSRGPVRLARDTVLNLQLRMPDFHISDSEDSIVWTGDIGNASFAVMVPSGLAEGRYPATVAFYADQLKVAQVHLTLLVAPQKSETTDLDTYEHRYKSAFASYASDDRDEVLGRIQGMQKVLPQLDIFVDVASLRSGERWRNRLTEEIRRRDVFYLFWSRAAADSVWVDREWRTAWRYRGVDVIDPVPLVAPETVQRVMGIEPTLSAWEAEVLPLNYTR